MVAIPIPKARFYVQHLTADGEWRFILDATCNIASCEFYPTAVSWQQTTAANHPGCPTRIVDQFGNRYGIPLVITEKQ